jgi:ATP-dependent DNA helicase RecG
MTPLELLQQLNDLDEHPRIEAKEASAMGRSVLETVCAFSNEPGLGGGWLLLGVKPDEQAFWRQYDVVGVHQTFTIDNATYRDLNRVDVLNASNHLRRLRDQGLLEQRGKGSATYYVPTERFVTSLWPDPVASGNAPALSGNPPALSGNPAALSGNPPLLTFDLPPDIRERLGTLSQRVSQPVLCELAIDLCRLRPFAADELAAILGKKRKYLLDRVLTPLLRNGQLLHTIPAQPNHPDQAYTAPASPAP